MSEDFDAWNRLKKEINDEGVVGDFSEREIWWCRIGHNIGFEENGKNRQFSRPVLIFRKFNQALFLRISLKYEGQNRQSLLPCFYLPERDQLRPALPTARLRRQAADRPHG